MHYDIFNGDADGILSLLQLRLADPIASELVTGVKRDIVLLDKLDEQRCLARQCWMFPWLKILQDYTNY